MLILVLQVIIINIIIIIIIITYLLLHEHNASVNSSCTHPPSLGNCGAFAQVVIELAVLAQFYKNFAKTEPTL